MAEKILMNEYKDLSKQTWTNISLVNDNVRTWSVALIVLNPDSLYYGGYFKAIMKFPENYPYSPPSFQFERPLWHPNVYPDGKLCISILHSPGEDAMSGEMAGERWSPVQRVESVLISVLSLLDDAECSSPANVDAGVQLRNNPDGYKQRIAEDREKSKQDIPAGFVMPTHETAFKKEEKVIDDFSWSDSEDEFDFDNSDDDEEMFDADEGTDQEEDDE
ncbi:ubiquitin conjugating enzyme like [Lecanosticta acicola]|uniref:Ubiquitin-conjugating enzyme E2 2 n=1 Tax=Lecanosticta acicola TaxID=111012 RepID=A0AAI9E963_9PEZI|nr:ubiquitin conjugating enzyme like [Lecanosticta acicola]